MKVITGFCELRLNDECAGGFMYGNKEITKGMETSTRFGNFVIHSVEVTGPNYIVAHLEPYQNWII